MIYLSLEPPVEDKLKSIICVEERLVVPASIHKNNASEVMKHYYRAHEAEFYESWLVAEQKSFWKTDSVSV